MKEKQHINSTKGVYEDKFQAAHQVYCIQISIVRTKASGGSAVLQVILGKSTS